MNIVNPKTALISLSDKTNLEEIVSFLIKKDVKILSTGGTYKAIKEVTDKVTEVSEFTGFEEIMDGRVKTLHPKIHAGILARRESDMKVLNERGYETIDLVIVNLYPFTETIYSLYVTDKERHLTGILSLRDLVTADPSKPIGDVKTRDVVNISTNTNQEEVARAIQRYDFLALPVVDKEKRLVGIVTVDDLIDVIEQEATRDIYAAGAVQPGDEDDYFQSSLFTIARRRIVWLLILVLANGLTTKVIAMNDQILKEIVLLAAFIPLLVGTGGNVGAQSSTVVIRGLSTQKLKSLGAIKAVVKEAITGALLGVFMMLVVFPFAWWQGEGPLIASAVGISLISITTLAATTGAILPLLFDRMKLDPALMSSPFITTVTDIAGVFIYLSTAKWLLSSSLV